MRAGSIMRGSTTDNNCVFSSNILVLMKDQYANYVVQRAIEVAKPMQRKILMYKIAPLLSAARKYMHAKHIVAKAEHYLTRSKCMI